MSELKIMVARDWVHEVVVLATPRYTLMALDERLLSKVRGEVSCSPRERGPEILLRD